MDNFEWLFIICATLGLLGLGIGIAAYVLQGRELWKTKRKLKELKEKLNGK